ncbi:hypothetical protein KYQ79_05995 [Escherichia coli]|nr:hypothetical protein [Escherichia coli]
MKNNIPLIVLGTTLLSGCAPGSVAPKVTTQEYVEPMVGTTKEGANKQVISSQVDSLIKISRIWADFFPANTSNQPI